MDFNKLTLKSQEAVAAAQELARRMGNPELYPEHLTLALLDQELPRQLVPDADALRAQAEATLRTRPRIDGAQQQPRVSNAVSRVLDAAFDEAKRMEDDYVSTEHLLLALDVVPRDQLLAKINDVRGGDRFLRFQRQLVEVHYLCLSGTCASRYRTRSRRYCLWIRSTSSRICFSSRAIRERSFCISSSIERTR